jgi:hypothetical protein
MASFAISTVEIFMKPLAIKKYGYKKAPPVFTGRAFIFAFA